MTRRNAHGGIFRQDAPAERLIELSTVLGGDKDFRSRGISLCASEKIHHRFPEPLSAMQWLRLNPVVNEHLCGFRCVAACSGFAVVSDANRRTVPFPLETRSI